MLKILIVEDDTDISEILSVYIKECQSDASIDTSLSARNALKMLEDRSYDIVITDMGTHDSMLGGCDVIDKANELGIWSVLCSGVTHDDCHPNYILPKPFTELHIENMFKKWKCKKSFKQQVGAKYKISYH